MAKHGSVGPPPRSPLDLPWISVVPLGPPAPWYSTMEGSRVKLILAANLEPQGLQGSDQSWYPQIIEIIRNSSMFLDVFGDVHSSILEDSRPSICWDNEGTNYIWLFYQWLGMENTGIKELQLGFYQSSDLSRTGNPEILVGILSLDITKQRRCKRVHQCEAACQMMQGCAFFLGAHSAKRSRQKELSSVKKLS